MAAMSNQKLAEVDGGPLDFPSSLFQQIGVGMAQDPDKTAVIVMHQAPDHLSDLFEESTLRTTPAVENACLSWTYNQLHKAALQLSAGLLGNNVKPGMRIMTLTPNRVEYHIVLWMCQILRLTLCSLDFGATSTARRQELAKLTTALRPDIILVLNQDAAAAVDEVLAKDADQVLLKIILEPTSTNTDWQSISSVVSNSRSYASHVEGMIEDARNDDPDRISLILFTSGTSTGNPKGCPTRVKALTYVTQSQTYSHSGTRWLHSSANFRVIAPAFCLGTWAAGGTVVVQDPTAGAKGTIAAIRDQGVNFMMLIPALLHILVADPDFAQLDVSNVEQTAIGGDMVTRDIYRKLCNTFPGAYNFVAHGMTECGAIVKWPYKGTAVDDIPYFGEICPLGTVSPGTMLRIRDPETGKTVTRNSLGELCISNPSTIRQYLNNQYPEMFFQDDQNREWFRTGDLGVINDDGIVYIVGRLKDVIKRAGVPITPAALESCIEKYTGAHVAVLAYAHPVLGQEPLVVMNSLNGKTAEEIRQRVLSEFSKDYALGPIVTLDDLALQAFPLNATGKIMKMVLLEKAKGVLDKLSQT